jgi:Ca-activated chloride channel family protein
VRLASAAAVLLATLLAAAAGLPQAGLLVPTRAGRPDAAVLAIREMTIEAELARGHARVSVRQVFENRTGAVQEGTYRFRLPAGATVSDFAVWDGLVRVPGVILEKQRARGIYRELTTQRIDPGLLQQGEEDEGTAASGGAAFAARVSPIPAWATKRVELQLQQEARVAGGRGEWRLPLAPSEGEPPVVGRLAVRVRLEDADPLEPPAGLPLRREGEILSFEGTDVRLDRDLVVRFRPRGDAPLRLSAFRTPGGSLPEGVALAPWERPSDLPPEKDGFFLLELLPPPAAPAAGDAAAAAREPVSLALVFDTSLSTRWSSLEIAYGQLVRALSALSPRDRFTLVAFDRRPAVLAPPGPASPERRRAALAALRERPLAPGSDVVAAVSEARRTAGAGARVLLLTDGPLSASSREIRAALGAVPLFTALSGDEAPEAYATASARLLPPGAAEAEADAFFSRLTGALEPAAAGRDAPATAPFTVEGGDPRLRDVYPVLAHPPAPGSQSGWVGRYAAPQAKARVVFASPLLAGGRAVLDAAFPEQALEARDVPRRWARARVDHLLARIEAEGERREWVDEVIALSKRYRFVTPYTAFLAAPRALLRPRRIQPGDPVLRVECDPGTVAATALLPFGERLPLVRRPGTRLWEGRFLVPYGFPDGRYETRLLLRDAGGTATTETKHFVIDGRAPVVRVFQGGAARAGETLRVAVATDEDVILLAARVGDGPPVPLRWDARAGRSTGLVPVPASAVGVAELFVEAVDGAKNRGFARSRVEVRP